MRLAIATITTLLPIAMGEAAPPKHKMFDKQIHRLYLGNYDGNIQAFTFTPPSTLVPDAAIPVNAAGSSPSWLAFATDGGERTKYVYSVDEDVPGRVFAHVVTDDKTGVLRKIGTDQQIKYGSYPGGDGPVALALTGQQGAGEKCLFVANYNNGSVGVFRLAPDGSIASTDAAAPSTVKHFQFQRPASSPVGPVSSRQDHSYAHEVVTSPTGRFVYVPDLGADQIHCLKLDPFSCEQTNLVGSTDVPAGSGPRHIAFYPPGQSTVGGQCHRHPQPPEGGKTYAYLASELACSLTAFAVDEESSKLTQIGEPVLAVPPGTPLGGTPTEGPQRTVAEVAVSPDGRFVYVSDRGDETEDHITIFSRDAHTGAIAFLKWVPSGGLNVRHFSLSLDPEAQYAAVGHQATGNAVIFKRDLLTGDLAKTGAEYANFPNLAFTGFAP
ncbi:3-carboxy-cis,cis-mucoante lactonizing enzyme [Tilletiaria anomala UBC 951]|uniref:3-carboxy-cis,cis-mucoante lactonizing enzyme n=1 Tax=Tilletiaria anomala (strain ATCC 24038 / CBS 436.72 / UBC 951) TaxID=1037660 RepID=A0A066VX30_TILAU|nr:3-carboxy-cis,cis-mucoante lactonizing enzyme [Tilletiaria anomala UBC 951]KDN43115.1 3-carboxy-cis,cis-mucoante lactonizing enzyme [Tilletiaria anomala UBC 951]